jgi:hypothetical protein
VHFTYGRSCGAPRSCLLSPYAAVRAAPRSHKTAPKHAKTLRPPIANATTRHCARDFAELWIGRAAQCSRPLRASLAQGQEPCSDWTASVATNRSRSAHRSRIRTTVFSGVSRSLVCVHTNRGPRRNGLRIAKWISALLYPALREISGWASGLRLASWASGRSEATSSKLATIPYSTFSRIAWVPCSLDNDRYSTNSAPTTPE